MRRAPGGRAGGLVPFLVLGAALALAGCGEQADGPAVGAATRVVAATGAAPTPSPTASPTPAATPTPWSPPGVARVAVTPVKEPNDHAHRNYCGAGATQVLVSAWLPAVPDIELVARLAHLDPNRGQTGADTVVAVNTLLRPVTGPALGADAYTGRHITELADLVAALRADLPSPRLTAAVGHGAPVMVQTMTRDLPGWNHWQATHMITIYAYDLRSGDPATETVSYAETPSAQAAYTGPPTQTISVALLWSAMLAHNRDALDDPVNLIS